MALFRARGVTAKDEKYATSARVYSMDEMLAFRETKGWSAPLDSAWDFDEIIAAARTPAEVKPPEELKMSENGFKVGNKESMDTKEKVVRQIQHTLNRLTEDNYAQLIPECLNEDTLDSAAIDDWVARIFAKALEEPMFCGLYAKMALDIAKYELTTLQKKGVRTAIVSRAQAVYEQDRAALLKVQEAEADRRQKVADAKEALKARRKEAKKANKNAKKFGGAMVSVDDLTAEEIEEIEASMVSEEDKEAAEKIRKKKLANMKLIGELLRCGLLADRIIIFIISGLILSEERPPEVDIEMVLELLKVSGELLEKRDGIERVYSTLNRLLEVKEPPLSNRVSFAVMDLLDLRKNGWKDKRKEAAEMKKSASQQDLSSSKNKQPSPLPQSPASPTSPSGSKGQGFSPQPPNISSENEKKIQKSMKEAAMAQMKTQEKVQEAVQLLRGFDKSIRDAVIVHHAATFACCSTDDFLNEAIFASFLMKGVWESNEEVTRGLAWCMCEAICNGIAEDVPKFFPRLAKNLVRSGWALDRLVSEVFGKVAWCLDITEDADPEWDETFLNLWELTLKAAGEEDYKVTLVTPEQVLDGMAQAKFTGFWAKMVGDMVCTLKGCGLASDEQVANWHAKHKNSGPARKLCEELELFI